MRAPFHRRRWLLAILALACALPLAPAPEAAANLIVGRRAGTAATNDLLTGLVAYWKLDEASGSAIDAHASYDLADSAGNVGQDTTNKVLGAASRTRTTASDTQRLTTGADLAAFEPPVFSISLWFRAGTIDANRREIATKVQFYTEGSYWLFVRSGDVTFRVSADGTEDGGGWHAVSAAVSADTWYHVVCGYDGTKLFLVLNDATPVTSTGLAPANKGGHFALFGNTDSTAQIGYVGQIDEVGFWSKDLSAFEITLLYNAGAGLPYEDFDSL